MSRFTRELKTSGNIEREFCIKYGSYPDRYYTNKIRDGLSPSEAFAAVQERIDDVWKEMRFNYKKQQEKLLS